MMSLIHLPEIRGECFKLLFLPCWLCATHSGFVCMELRRFIYATAVAIFLSIYFPQKRWVLRSQPERYAAKDFACFACTTFWTRTSCNLILQLLPSWYIYIYIYTYRERENIYTHRHISSKKTKNFHPQPISPNSYHGCPTFTGAGMCFTRRPALKTARTMEATPIILGSLGASPGSMERFMTFLLAYICILYIYVYICIYIWEIKKMGNLWEIYTFHQTWPGKFEKFSHVHDSRRPKFHGPYMATTGVSPPPDMPIWWTMMCVCVSRNCVDTSNWLFEFEWEKCGFEVLN